MYNNRIDSVAASAVPGRMDPGGAAAKAGSAVVVAAVGSETGDAAERAARLPGVSRAPSS